MHAAPTVFTASVQKKSIGRCIERSGRRHASHDRGRGHTEAAVPKGVEEDSSRGGEGEVTRGAGWEHTREAHKGYTGGRTGHSLRLYRILVKCEIFYGHSSER